MKELTWKHVTIAVAFLACVTSLALTNVDSGPLIMVGMAILAGIGWVGQKAAENGANTAAVKEQTNGTQTKMLQMLEAQGQLLAAMRPPATLVAPDDEYTEKP